MVDIEKYRQIVGSENLESEEDVLNSKIEENLQKRELMKLRQMFYENLRSYYMQRKFKEQITIGCSDRCLKGPFREDDLTRQEMNCMVGCFNKYYRFMGYSNTVYTYLTNPDAVRNYMGQDIDEESQDGLQQQNVRQPVISMADKIA
eukprot:403365869